MLVWPEVIQYLLITDFLLIKRNDQNTIQEVEYILIPSETKFTKFTKDRPFLRYL